MINARPWFADREQLPPLPLPPGDFAALARQRLHDIPFPSGALPLSPVLLRPRAYRELFDTASRLLRLARRALLKSGQNPTERLAALGVHDDTTYPLFFADDALERRYSTCIARPDAVIGPEGIRFLEINISGAVGGVVQAHILTQLWHDLHAKYADLPFQGIDPFAARAELLRSVCAAQRLPPQAMVIGSVRDLGLDSTRFFDLEVDYLRQSGLRADFLEPERLQEALDRSALPPSMLGLMGFTVYEWRELAISWEPVREALDRGCLLLASQTGSLIANKKVLAWLSRGDPAMSASEREFVGHYLPWTRIVADTTAEWRGRRHGLLDLIIARREEFVLKKAIGMKGREVVMGLDSTEVVWSDAVDEAIRRDDSIVQQYVPPFSLPQSVEMDGHAETLEVTPIISPYLFNERPAGCLVRYLPTARAGVISAQGFGAMENIAFAVR